MLLKKKKNKRFDELIDSKHIKISTQITFNTIKLIKYNFKQENKKAFV